MSKVPTCDEIIDDLTKDLENHCVANDVQPATTQNILETSRTQSDESAVDELVNKALNDKTEDDNEEETSESPNGNKPAIPEDYIDEEALKEEESTLTEAELTERHQKSIEIKNKGNQEFRDELYLESIQTYTDGLHICPLKHKNDRAILYCNRSASKIKLKRIEAAIDDCTKAIELNPGYQRAYLRRAAAFEEKDKLDEALEDYKKLLELDPGQKDAREAIHRLPPLIQARNEKLKDEMLGKLKDLGNMFLKPFGLSTNNFKMQQDPNTGGYSVNFQQ